MNNVHTEATAILSGAKAKAEEIMAKAIKRAEEMEIEYIHMKGGVVGDEVIEADDNSGCFVHPHKAPKWAPYECAGGFDGFQGDWGQCKGDQLSKMPIDNAAKCAGLCHMNSECTAYHHVAEDGKWQCVTFKGDVELNGENKCSAHCCKKWTLTVSGNSEENM